MKNGTNLKKALDNRGIKALIFDLDNTVFDTDPYYIDKKEASFLEIVSHFPVKNEAPVITAQKISQDVRRKFFERNCKPLPVKIEYEEGLRDFYKENYHPLMDEILDKHLEGFYENTPEIFPEAIDLFSFFYHYPNMKFFAANTLAGEDWTKVKIEYMEQKCDIPHIPYYTTDIEHPKDWAKPVSDAIKKGVALEEILVIGDSLNSDILPSIEQGVEHLIWIDREERRDEVITSFSSVSKVMIVETLSDVWDLK